MPTVPTGHILGSGCPCSATLLKDGHPHKCSCGGHYHLADQGQAVVIVCDVCGKDRAPYDMQDLRI